MACCRNVGPVDRVIRAVIGLGALTLAFVALDVLSGGVWGIVAAVVGVVMLGTAAMGVCPLYVPFKMSTCRSVK